MSLDLLLYLTFSFQQLNIAMSELQWSSIKAAHDWEWLIKRSSACHCTSHKLAAAPDAFIIFDQYWTWWYMYVKNYHSCGVAGVELYLCVTWFIHGIVHYSRTAFTTYWHDTHRLHVILQYWNLSSRNIQFKATQPATATHHIYCIMFSIIWTSIVMSSYNNKYSKISTCRRGNVCIKTQHNIYSKLHVHVHL